MKKLLFYLLALYSSISLSQTRLTFTMLNQSENKLLDSYCIDYTGAYVRSMVISNEYKKLDDNEIQIDFEEAYMKFEKWNKGYFKAIPDTNYISDGTEYMKDKNANELLKITFNETRKILGKFSIKVNDVKNNIRTIEILELYNTGMENYIDHIIMVENYKGFWELITYDDEDPTLDCGQCMVP